MHSNGEKTVIANRAFLVLILVLLWAFPAMGDDVAELRLDRAIVAEKATEAPPETARSSGKPEGIVIPARRSDVDVSKARLDFASNGERGPAGTFADDLVKREMDAALQDNLPYTINYSLPTADITIILPNMNEGFFKVTPRPR